MSFEYEVAEPGGFGLVRSNLAHFRMVPGTFTMSTQYPTGGESLNLDRYFTKCMGMMIEPKNGYTFEYDLANKKVKAFYILCDTSVTITPDEVPAGEAVDIVVEHGAFKVGDYLAMQPPSNLEAGLVPIAAWVTEAGKAKVRIYNPTAAAVTGVGRSWNLLTLTPSKREVFANKNLSGLGSIRFIAWGI